MPYSRDLQEPQTQTQRHDAKPSKSSPDMGGTSSGLMQSPSKFVRSNRGNVAIMFGICVVPIVMSAAVAVDLSRALIVRERLGQALDAAALAVGGNATLSEEAQQDLADSFFAANYPAAELGVPSAINVTAGESIVYLSASADVPTTLMKIFHYESLTVNAATEVTKESNGLEVVMVLDNTGSMSGSKLASLKTAADDLVDILFGEEETPDLLRVGMVPFAAAVNIGTDSLASGWIDDTAASTLAGHAFSPGVNVLDLYDEISNRSWNGCVETRLPPYHTTDDAPNAGNPDTLWLPFFSPDHPDGGGGYDNDYLKDKTGGSDDNRQRNDSKYNNSTVNAASKGPLKECTVPEVTPLTNVKQDLLDAIDAMDADGYTHIPVGMAWGWRLISPTEPFTEGAEYDDEDWDKAIILLTDGKNTIDTESTHNGSNYSAYGFLAEGRLGTTNENAYVDQMNDDLTTVCDSVKDEDIRVYTITFQLDDDDTKDIMRDCATEDALYFDSPSEEDLEATFQAIAKDLSNLRLSM